MDRVKPTGRTARCQLARGNRHKWRKREKASYLNRRTRSHAAGSKGTGPLFGPQGTEGCAGLRPVNGYELPALGDVLVLRRVSWRILYGRRNLGDQVAQRCRAPVLRRVLPEAAAMSRAEARGYVRARSSRLVAIYSRLLITEMGGDDGLVPALTALARRRVVSLVLEDLWKYHPAPQVGRRAA